MNNKTIKPTGETIRICEEELQVTVAENGRGLNRTLVYSPSGARGASPHSRSSW